MRGAALAAVEILADCCPTCLIVDELAKEFEVKIKFVKVDAETGPEISARHHVIALPYIMLFHDSKPVKALLGFQGKTSLRYLLDALIAAR